MTENSTTSKHTVVAPWKDRLRFPITGKRTNQWKPGRRRYGRAAAPTICGHPHPDRGYEVRDDDGNIVRSAIVAHRGPRVRDEREGRVGLGPPPGQAPHPHRPWCPPALDGGRVMVPRLPSPKPFTPHTASATPSVRVPGQPRGGAR